MDKYIEAVKAHIASRPDKIHVVCTATMRAKEMLFIQVSKTRRVIAVSTRDQFQHVLRSLSELDLGDVLIFSSTGGNLIGWHFSDKPVIASGTAEMHYAEALQFAGRFQHPESERGVLLTTLDSLV